MASAKFLPSSRRSFSLTVRVSALLVFAVVLPLLITVVGSELILRPTLLAQAATEMGNDAQSHTQAIDALFIAHLQDLEYLGQFFAIQKYLSGDDLYKAQALNELSLGLQLDTNNSNLTLFDTHSAIRLSYPGPPGSRGKYQIPPEIVQQLHGVNKTLISDVFFDDQTHVAAVDIYATITAPSGTLLGYGRITLKLNDLWTAVNNETNAAANSYAIVLDGNGVRIAYTNIDTTLTTLPQGLFKAVGTISPQFQQRIQNENLYGNNSRAAVTTLADPQLGTLQQNATTFQLVPALQTATYQAYQSTSHVVPWTYLVLRPINTITQAANQQDIYLFLIATIVTLLAGLVGLLVGRGITRPILSSVSSLIASSQMLQTLSSREEVTATEQKWIVESSQTGLQSVQYYAEATSVAAAKLENVSKNLLKNWEHIDAKQAKQWLGEISAASTYIGQATSHQERSGQSLATAIRIATQVTDQLISGASSASEAANQLEEVIAQLQRVVGQQSNKRTL